MNGTERMAQRLQRLDFETDPEGQPFLNGRRAQFYQRMLRGNLKPAEAASTSIKAAIELIQQGESMRGVELLASLRVKFQELLKASNPTVLRTIDEFIALGWLRVGEQENCISNHNIDSCLMPIQGGGVHIHPNGSRQAIERFTALLTENPSDYKSLWLLNIAYMTLGEYPEKVPAKLLIPPSAFASEYEVPRFYDIAGQCGVARGGLAGGCITDDFNNDGYLDIMATSWGLLDQIHYYENDRKGGFIDRTEAAGLIGVTGGLNLTQADYDNDGDIDFLISRGAWLNREGRIPDSLIRNNGDGTFEDVTVEANVLSFHPSQAACWGDYNNDGWVDLFIGNESSPRETHVCELFRNNADGTFTECGAEAGVAKVAFVKGCVWGDYNNDGLLDLYVSVLGGPNALYRNDGGSKFTDVAEEAGVTKPINSFPTWFWDYDNDGWLDLFVSSYPPGEKSGGRIPATVRECLGMPQLEETARLYRNNRDGTFKDVTTESSFDHMILTMGANFGDIDNDGWPDAYLGTGDPDYGTLVPNRLFRNHGGKLFQDVTTAANVGNLQKGHGVAFADLDNDGDQDIYIVLGGAYGGDLFRAALYENPGFGNHWITLRLEGEKTNRSAIGARIKVSLDTPNGPRDFFASVTSGGSFGASGLQQEIGLGDASAIRSIEIVWPTSGTTQKFTGVELDQVLAIRETDTAPRKVALDKLDLSPQGTGVGLKQDCPCPK